MLPGSKHRLGHTERENGHRDNNKIVIILMVLPGSKHRSAHSEGRIETQINIFENCLDFANIFACLKVSELFSLIKKKF